MANKDPEGTPSAPPSGEEPHRLVKQRLEKAERIRAQGLDPYANDFRPELTCQDFRARYDAGSAEELEKIHTVTTVAGRIMLRREMGKAQFLTIRDATGDLQIYVKKDRVGDKTFEHLKLLDIGDIIGVAGTPMRTKTGELTVAADGLRVLTKSLRPLPEKWEGLQDVEQRYRQRYVDLIVNPDVRRVFKTRAQVVRGIQAYLDKRGFLEVETPMLGDLAGGAVARPFVTHHNALGQDLFLRIATELHLKRLVVGGLERVYEIGRNFRNEGVSTRHNPEFTSIEVYQAYANYADMMELTEECISDLVDTIHGRTKIAFADKEVEFARPWRRAPIAQLVAEHLGIKDDITGITSVERALTIVENHCVTPDTPLHVCLREMTDADAERVVPGLEKGGEPLVERAKAAFKNAKDKHAFYVALGKAMDQLWASAPGGDGASAEGDEITLKGRPAHSLGVEVTNPGVTVPTAPANGGALEDETGEIPLGPRTHDTKRASRRACALSLLYAVFDHEVERTLVNPTFITDFSVSVSPLARRRDSDPALVDRFELIIAGMELANAFSELNDPVDQRGRFEGQLRDRERGDNEAHEMDEDYLRALEVGLPPTAGLGIGIDRLVMVLTNQQSIRDVILFPQMRRAASSGT